MLHHKFSDKKFVINAILKSTAGGDLRMTRRMALYVIINFLFGGRHPDPVSAEKARLILLRAFRNVI